MKRKFLSKVSIVTTLIAMSLSSTAFAASGVNVGGLIGYGSGNGGGLTFGGEVGYRLDPTWELGVSFLTQSTSTSTTILGVTLNSSTSLSMILANFDYHFAGDMSPLFVGLQAGLGMSSATVLGVGATTSNLAAGIHAGYDFNISGGLSIGPEARLTFIFGSPMTTTFSGLAAIKYAF